MEQFTQEMMKRLEALAGKLGMAAAALWGFYTRQAYVTGAEQIVCCVVCVVGALVFNHYRVSCWEKGEKDRYSDWKFGSIMLGIGEVILVGLAVMFLCFSFTALFNPGYWAFQTIVEQLR